MILSFGCWRWMLVTVGAFPLMIYPFLKLEWLLMNCTIGIGCWRTKHLFVVGTDILQESNRTHTSGLCSKKAFPFKSEAAQPRCVFSRRKRIWRYDRHDAR